MENSNNGFKVWDADNKEYLLGGTAFNHQDAAIAFAGDWLKIHADKYSEKSTFEIHQVKNGQLITP